MAKPLISLRRAATSALALRCPRARPRLPWKVKLLISFASNLRNGSPKEGQEEQREHQLSSGPRHEVRKVPAGLQTDPRQPKTGQGQARHYCQQHSSPQEV